MNKLSLPIDLLRNLGANFRERFWEYGRQQLVDDSANGLLSAPSIEPLTTRRPTTDDTIESVNDDIRAVEDLGDLVQPGFRGLLS